MLNQLSCFWRHRIIAGTVHLGISICIVALAATLVFAVWYPYPYSEISGGRELFSIVAAVDVILGPLVTLVVFNSTKSRKELRRDMVLVALVQLSALGYGLWAVCVARPVYMVFEYDRFRVVHAVEVESNLLAKAPEGFNKLPITGPTLLGLRPFKDNIEKMDATLAALQGVSLASRPELWESYERIIPQILAEAKPLSALKVRLGTEAEKLVRSKGRDPSQVVYLPLVGRKSFWTVLLDGATAEVLAYVPLDSF